MDDEGDEGVEADTVIFLTLLLMLLLLLLVLLSSCLSWGVITDCIWFGVSIS